MSITDVPAPNRYPASAVAVGNQIRQHAQGALVWAVREFIDDLAGMIGELLSAFARALNAAAALHHRVDIREGSGIVRPVAEHHGNLLAFGRRRVLQRVDQRESDLALLQISADGLAQGLFAGSEVEHVVDQLERHAEVPGEFAQFLFGRRFGARRHRAELGAGGEKACGLAVGNFHAVRFGDVDAADTVELNQLAFDHHLGEADEQIEDMEVALAQGGLEGLHIEPVARQHAGVIAPLDIGRGAAAPGLRDVDYVVVDKGRGVNHFDHRAQLDRGVASATGKSRGQQEKGGPQALAAALLEITADGGNGFNGGKRFDVDRFLHAFEVLAHKIENLARRESLSYPFSFHQNHSV